MPTAAGFHYFIHEGGSSLKPPLVLIHGAGGDHLSWPAEVRRLPGYRVFSLDLPGHGKSQGHGRQFIENYAADVIGFIDVLGFNKVVFIGYSMGGAVALTLACNYPERVAGIGLISTGPCLPIPSKIIENAANPSTLPQAIQSLQQLSFGSQSPPAMKDLYIKRLIATRPTVLLNDLQASDRFDMRERLTSISTPVLVVCGKDDKLTPLHFSEILSSQIPGAALQTIEGAGHMLVLEQPSRLAKLINIFLITIQYIPGM